MKHDTIESRLRRIGGVERTYGTGGNIGHVAGSSGVHTVASHPLTHAGGCGPPAAAFGLSILVLTTAPAGYGGVGPVPEVIRDGVGQAIGLQHDEVQCAGQPQLIKFVVGERNSLRSSGSAVAFYIVEKAAP